MTKLDPKRRAKLNAVMAQWKQKRASACLGIRAAVTKTKRPR